ncbi:MAG: hypothetical protein IKV32_00195 [Muribaculaceae bacterium]|nr:hypothetical protein [Muribaculaceae bacterium]
MKPENVKKVWEYFKGYKIRYHITRPERIIAAIKKNISGDLSLSEFYGEIEARVHLLVKEYIVYLLNQEALEKAQEEQALLEAQQKAQKEANKEKPQKQEFIYSKGRIGVSMANPRCNQHRRKLNSKNNSSTSGSSHLFPLSSLHSTRGSPLSSLLFPFSS